jgi:hypothetical protein
MRAAVRATTSKADARNRAAEALAKARNVPVEDARTS